MEKKVIHTSLWVDNKDTMPYKPKKLKKTKRITLTSKENQNDITESNLTSLLTT